MEIEEFPACSIQDNTEQARFPRNYCRRRIPVSPRESTTPSGGGGGRNAECKMMNGEFLWGTGQDERDWREAGLSGLLQSISSVWSIPFIHLKRLERPERPDRQSADRQVLCSARTCFLFSALNGVGKIGGAGPKE